MQAKPPPKWDAPKPLALPRIIGQRLLIHDHQRATNQLNVCSSGRFRFATAASFVEGGIGLVVGDACPANGRRILEAFAAEQGMQLLTRDQFALLFLAEMWEIGTTSVTFNAPWDHSRFACGWMAREENIEEPLRSASRAIRTTHACESKRWTAASSSWSLLRRSKAKPETVHIRVSSLTFTRSYRPDRRKYVARKGLPTLSRQAPEDDGHSPWRRQQALHRVQLT